MTSGQPHPIAVLIKLPEVHPNFVSGAGFTRTTTKIGMHPLGYLLTWLQAP
jgi:hypothetical protein